MRFSDYIRQRRNEAAHTQSQLAQSLAGFDRLFTNVDANTIGRWERGLQAPSLQRQQLCVVFFGDDPNKLIPFNSPTFDLDSTELEDFRQHLSKQLDGIRFDSLVGGLPLHFSPSIDVDKDKTVDATYLNFVAELDTSLLPTPQPMTTEKLQQWMQHSGGQLWLSRHHQQTLLHLLFLKLKPSAYQRVIQLQCYESSLGPEDLAEENEPFCFYIASFFSSHIESLVELYISLFRYIYKHRDRLLHIGSTIANNDGLKLCRLLQMDICQTGPEVSTPGVTLGRKHYHSATLDAQLHEILSSPLARRCLRK